MFRILVTLHVRDAADVDQIAAWLKEAAELSLAESGCQRFEVYQARDDRQTFVLSEWWSSEADWQTHRQERAFTEIYAPLILPRVERTPLFVELVSPGVE